MCLSYYYSGRPVIATITLYPIGRPVRAGAYELPKAAKEHETYTACRVPSQSKSIAS